MASKDNVAAARVGQLLLAAPFEQSGWATALRALADFTRSSHGELIGIDSFGNVAFNWTTDADPNFFSEFEALSAADPDWNWRVAASLSPFEIASEEDYAAVRARCPGRYEAYDEFAHRYDMENGCQAVLSNGRDSFVGLAVLRSRADGRTSAEDRGAFAAVAPHVLNAVRLQRALEDQGALMMAGALDQAKAVAFICNARGEVCGLTGGADAWLAETSRMVIRDGRLICSRPAEDRRLNEAIKTGLADARQGAIDRFWLRGAAGHLDSDICEIFTLPPRPFSLGFEPRILVTIQQPALFAGQGQELLEDMWGLSRAECAVAVLLAKGYSRERIASSRSTSPLTVQAQIKCLFRKCGVNREAELVALLRGILR